MRKNILQFAIAMACTWVHVAHAAWFEKVRLNEPGVEVLSLNQSSTKSGVMKVSVTFKSDSRLDEEIKYRVVWFDENNAEINSTVSNWVKRSLTAQHTYDFIAIAPGKRAVDYAIEFDNQ